MPALFERWLRDRIRRVANRIVDSVVFRFVRVPRWRRVALGVAVTVLAGCAPALRPTSRPAPPLFIPPLRKAPLSTDPLAVRFTEGAASPSGCFAISRRTGAVACLLGHYRAGSDWGERHLVVLSNSEEMVPEVTVLVQRTDSGVKLEPQSQRMLDALMRDGDFIGVGAPVTLPPNTPRSFGGLTIELRREEIFLSSMSMSDIKVVVRVEPRDGDGGAPSDQGENSDVLFANTLTTTACSEPSLSIRLLEPTIVLIERECRVDDGGDTEVTSSAWLCDSDRSRCD
jgi:hypothetical protein